MRGVKCSWKEMQRLHRDVLPALEAGDGKRYSELRCVTPAAISQWRRASSVMQILDASELRYLNFESFQPSHATVIASHFREEQDKSKGWPDATKAEIVELVQRCEDERLTVKQLREVLHANGYDPAAHSEGPDQRVVSDLADLAGETFACFYADPPWQYGNKSTRASTDKTKKHYGTLTVEQLRAMPIKDLAATDAHLHLWTTNAFLPHAFRVIEAWGFEYRSCFVWVKPQMGIGNYWWVSHEFLLLGIRGKAKSFADKSLMSWAELERGEHSAKPEKVRGFVVKASKGPYLELFGREGIPGWTVYGNQISKQTRFAR